MKHLRIFKGTEEFNNSNIIYPSINYIETNPNPVIETDPYIKAKYVFNEDNGNYNLFSPYSGTSVESLIINGSEKINLKEKTIRLDNNSLKLIDKELYEQILGSTIDVDYDIYDFNLNVLPKGSVSKCVINLDKPLSENVLVLMIIAMDAKDAGIEGADGYICSIGMIGAEDIEYMFTKINDTTYELTSNYFQYFNYYNFGFCFVDISDYENVENAMDLFYVNEDSGSLLLKESCIDKLYKQTINLKINENTNNITSTGTYDVKILSRNNSYLFEDITSIVEIEFSKKFKEISNNVCDGCENLSKVTIPNSVTSIGEEAFYNCTSLTDITIPNSVTEIGKYAFYNCTSLTDITISNSVTKIDEYVFQGCTGLVDITIPNSVTEIGKYAFQECTGLKSITIPNSVTKISGNAFQRCTNLVDITIPNSVTEIGSFVFSYCTSLTDITIPNSVTNINTGSFSGCTGLKSITIPNSVTNISGSAFSGCTGLVDIIIPNSVTEIDTDAFSSCASLKEIKIEDGDETLSLGSNSYGTELFYGSPIESLYLGRNLSYEGNYSLFGNINTLKEITIGNSVTSIGNYTFAGCTGLTEIISLSITEPEIQTDTFSNVNRNGVLKYPSGSDYSTWISALSEYGWTFVEI